MTADTEPKRDHWNRIVVPTASALEQFFWKLAWFVLLVVILFGGPCFSRSASQGERHEQPIAHPAR